jgi:hypothetical protein
MSRESMRRSAPAGDFPAPTSLTREECTVTLVGAGRSGGHIARTVAMLGFPLHLYDFDRLGPENLGRQLYRRRDIAAARPKVRALRAEVRAVVPGAVVHVHPERFTAARTQAWSPCLVVAVDSMRERRALWGRLHEDPHWVLLLDVRIGPATVRLHEVRPAAPGDREDYEASLYGDPDPAGPPPCGQESTAHAAAAAAALVSGALCAFVDGSVRPRWIAVDLDRAHWAAGPTRGSESYPGEESA